MRWRAALGRFLAKWRCRLFHGDCGPYLSFCDRERRIAPLAPPQSLSYDWLRDDAPLWQPGSTAFWLEPETHDQLAAWYAKYRPGVTGIVEAAGLRIEIVPPSPCAHRNTVALDRWTYGCADCGTDVLDYGLRQNPYANAYAMGTRTLSDYYKQSPRNKLPGGWL